MKKVVFLNTAWMDFYDGKKGDDMEIHGGGSYVEENGYGHEIFNFSKINGKVYGYAQPKGKNNLERLGASMGADKISDILVVFTARHSEGGTYIVGWYKHATFYREYQETRLIERKFQDEYLGYYVEADAKNATLLSIDERLGFGAVPRGKGGMGRSNVWYADSDEARDFVNRVIKNIDSYSKKPRNQALKVNRATDFKKKKQVEEIAVKVVKKYYEDIGYAVTSFETDNKGWDLEAKMGNTHFKIEVKGLSCKEISAELTPNEYKQMGLEKDSYRLCIVTCCLDKPNLSVFSYSNEKGNWANGDGDVLEFKEFVAARCYV